VAVKIEHAVYQSAKMFGRHFDDKDDVLSHVTRTSIDVLKVRFQAFAFPSVLIILSPVFIQRRCHKGGMGPHQESQAGTQTPRTIGRILLLIISQLLNIQ
jgi:hypothetical protein